MMVALDCQPVIALDVEDYIFGNGRGGKADSDGNFAYIVHTANAYPRLITGLREAMLLLPPDFRHDARALLTELNEV